MAHIPELSRRTYYERTPNDGYKYRSVGWLGRRVPKRGPTAPEVLVALRRAQKENRPAWAPRYLGFHTCEICNDATNGGEFIVTNGKTRYILPKMVFHYIEAHDYRLPKEVEGALLDESRWERLGDAPPLPDPSVPYPSEDIFEREPSDDIARVPRSVDGPMVVLGLGLVAVVLAVLAILLPRCAG